jgi:uncharacterized protein YukE
MMDTARRNPPTPTLGRRPYVLVETVTVPPLPVIDTAPDRVSGPSSGPDTRSGFSVDPIVLIGTAGVFDAEAAVMKMMMTRLEQQLAVIGKAWGDDVVGARFGAAYEPASRMVLANLASLSAGLVRIAAALRAVGESYEAVDNNIISAVSPTTVPTPVIALPVGVIPRPRVVAGPTAKPCAVEPYSPMDISNPIDETSGG